MRNWKSCINVDEKCDLASQYPTQLGYLLSIIQEYLILILLCWTTFFQSFTFIVQIKIKSVCYKLNYLLLLITIYEHEHIDRNITITNSNFHKLFQWTLCSTHVSHNDYVVSINVNRGIVLCIF